MKRRHVILIILMLSVVVVFASPSIAYAASYTTETTGPEGSSVPTQTAYTPEGRIVIPNGSSVEDMAIDEKNELIYIADKGAKRVVVMGLYDGQLKHVFGEGVLDAPTGVALDSTRLFVADSGRKLIYVYSVVEDAAANLHYGDLLKTIDKPKN